jgi:antitoxin ParD1/3/4
MMAQVNRVTEYSSLGQAAPFPLAASDTEPWYKRHKETNLAGKNTSFSIGERFMRFVDAQVKEGRYSNASDAMRAALVDGEESGPSTPFDFETFIARKRNEKFNAL